MSYILPFSINTFDYITIADGDVLNSAVLMLSANDDALLADANETLDVVKDVSSTVKTYSGSWDNTKLTGFDEFQFYQQQRDSNVLLGKVTGLPHAGNVLKLSADNLISIKYENGTISYEMDDSDIQTLSSYYIADQIPLSLALRSNVLIDMHDRPYYPSWSGVYGCYNSRVTIGKNVADSVILGVARDNAGYDMTLLNDTKNALVLCTPLTNHKISAGDSSLTVIPNGYASVSSITQCDGSANNCSIAWGVKGNASFIGSAYNHSLQVFYGSAANYSIGWCTRGYVNNHSISYGNAYFSNYDMTGCAATNSSVNVFGVNNIRTDSKKSLLFYTPYDQATVSYYGDSFNMSINFYNYYYNDKSFIHWIGGNYGSYISKSISIKCNAFDSSLQDSIAYAFCTGHSLSASIVAHNVDMTNMNQAYSSISLYYNSHNATMQNSLFLFDSNSTAQNVYSGIALFGSELGETRNIATQGSTAKYGVFDAIALHHSEAYGATTNQGSTVLAANYSTATSFTLNGENCSVVVFNRSKFEYSTLTAANVFAAFSSYASNASDTEFAALAMYNGSAKYHKDIIAMHNCYMQSYDSVALYDSSNYVNAPESDGWFLCDHSFVQQSTHVDKYVSSRHDSAQTVSIMNRTSADVITPNSVSMFKEHILASKLSQDVRVFNGVAIKNCYGTIPHVNELLDEVIYILY